MGIHRRGRRKTHRESEIVLSDTGPGIIIKRMAKSLTAPGILICT
jgi:hypothetical protein